MELATWRLLITPPASGPWNMAVDEAILESVGSGSSLPVLRLYAWQPACLSLGYSQPAADVDRTALKTRGWDLVRRPTGGRAILHTDELTYSVIAPLREPRVYGKVLDSYRRLSLALLDALQRLGLQPKAEKSGELPIASQPVGPVCFEVPSDYEITVNGKKLIGSAQARRKEGVLQHGSLPLTGDLTRITQVLAYPDEAARLSAGDRLLERAVTVETALGKTLAWEEASKAFVCGFEQALDLVFEAQELGSSERTRAEQLVVEKYGHPSWTLRL
jgi:lipoyl(octanoyl) transferase